jgi:PAS domain S-box-containing protein
MSTDCLGQAMGDCPQPDLATDVLQVQRDLFLALCNVHDLPTTLHLCLDAAVRVSGMDCGTIYLVDDAGGLRLAHSLGLSPATVEVAAHYPPHTAYARLVMAGEPVYLNRDSPSLPQTKPWEQEGVRGWAVVPIRQEGRVTAALNVASRTLDDIPTERRMALETIASGAGLLIGRARTDEALRQSEARYRAVVEDQTEIICRLDASGAFTFANDVYCRFFGKTLEQLLGREWQPLAFADDIPTIEEKVESLSPSNPVAVIENRVHTGDGQIRWMQFVNRALFDSEGRLTELQCVGRDITSRKQAEAAIEQKNVALRELVEQLAAEKSRIHDDIVANIEEVVMPLVGKLRSGGASQEYVDLLKHHLSDITSSYSRSIVRKKAFNLTPRETEICDMVKAGMASKEIAGLLGLSVQTVLRHRRNIRRRLHLTGEKENLASFLAGS